MAVALTINEVPVAAASITPIPDLECGVTTTGIEANLPSGLEGRWSSPGNVTFSNPNSPTTMVSGLGAANTVVWTLIDPLCGGDVSSATATINSDGFSAASLDDIPDVLTPNNDGLNDALRIPAADCREFGFMVLVGGEMARGGMACGSMTLNSQNATSQIAASHKLDFQSK